MATLDTEAVVRLANANPAFRLAARYWTARLAFDVGDERYVLELVDGAVTGFARDGAGAGPDAGTDGFDARVHGPAASWAKLLQPIPPPRLDKVATGMRGPDAVAVDGDLVGTVGPYFDALQGFVAVLRESVHGPTPVREVPDVDRAFDTAVGRYAYVTIHGVQHRVYFEEAGTGDIPMVLQHTAGADGRQWRHVLEDPDYQRLFRMIAYDLPFHGKSLPPTGVRWWETRVPAHQGLPDGRRGGDQPRPRARPARVHGLLDRRPPGARPRPVPPRRVPGRRRHQRRPGDPARRQRAHAEQLVPPAREQRLEGRRHAGQHGAHEPRGVPARDDVDLLARAARPS